MLLILGIMCLIYYPHVVRLVFDRDTGKAKGYGFCEFRDSDTALSAMRNLNGRDLNGRSLRVDFADGEKHTTGANIS